MPAAPAHSQRGRRALIASLARPGLQGNTGRKIGELRGHTSSVTSIALDDSLNQVVGVAASPHARGRSGLRGICC